MTSSFMSGGAKTGSHCEILSRTMRQEYADEGSSFCGTGSYPLKEVSACMLNVSFISNYRPETLRYRRSCFLKIQKGLILLERPLFRLLQRDSTFDWHVDAGL